MDAGCPTHHRAFTLVELMVVVAVVAILAAIAFPFYNEHVRRARRADAQGALAGLAIAMERHYTERTPSAYTGAASGGADTGPPAIYPTQAPLGGANKYYNLTIQSASATAFEVRAIPKNAQAGDRCGTLTLDSAGQRDVTGGSMTDWTKCWR